MTLPGFITAAAGAWAVLAGLGGFTWAFVVTRLKRRTQRIDGAYPDCIPVRPRITQAGVDATWLAAWPSVVDDDELTDLEFVSLIASTWQWPDTEDADQ